MNLSNVKEKYLYYLVLKISVFIRVLFTCDCFRLDHPNVVKLLEAYESKTSVYLVMEL